MIRYERLTRYAVLFLIISIYGGFSPVSAREKSGNSRPIGMAVEFTDHAACAYIALDKGWYAQAGLKLSSYKSYATGTALAAALARGDIQAAYICLVPAINVYVNAKVPIKIVAGTHRYGYGLVVDPDKIHAVRDLEKPGIRIGCVREGGAVDILLHKTMDNYRLNRKKILLKVQRMSPPSQLLAIKMHRLEAAFLPEQWASMAEAAGFKMLLTAKDLWPGMQGSVLVVKKGLIEAYPETVRKLVKVTQRATRWVNREPIRAALIMHRRFTIEAERCLPSRVSQAAAGFGMDSRILLRSMKRLEYTVRIEPKEVQKEIDYMYHLGYLTADPRAEGLMDLSFLK